MIKLIYMIYYFNKTLITFLQNKNITTKKIARRCMHIAIKYPLCEHKTFKKIKIKNFADIYIYIYIYIYVSYFCNLHIILGGNSHHVVIFIRERDDAMIL